MFPFGAFAMGAVADLLEISDVLDSSIALDKCLVNLLNIIVFIYRSGIHTAPAYIPLWYQ